MFEGKLIRVLVISNIILAVYSSVSNRRREVIEGGVNVGQFSIERGC